MSRLPSAAPENSDSPVRVLEIPQLLPFEDSDWEAISKAFEAAPVLPFRQAWLEKTEPGFRDGEVRLGWQEEGICVWARMEDDRIFTEATANQQHLWRLGDVFEIFVRDTANTEYLELHTAPTGHRLQLRFGSEQVIEQLRDGHGELEDYMVIEPLFHASVRTVLQGWEVLAVVSAEALGAGGSLAGRNFLASFSRYDYRDAAAPPVLSSTAAHRVLNFHRQGDWAQVRCAN